jgi:hypothetical protein
MTRTQPLDGGEYICKAVNESGHERITREITVIPIVAPTNGKRREFIWMKERGSVSIAHD